MIPTTPASIQNIHQSTLVELIENSKIKSKILDTNLVNIHLFKWCLEYFKVLYIFMFQIGFELDSLHGHGSGEQHVHELTVGGSRAQLLDLGEAGGETVVDPRQHVVPRQIFCRHICWVYVDCHYAIIYSFWKVEKKTHFRRLLIKIDLYCEEDEKTPIYGHASIERRLRYRRSSLWNQETSPNNQRQTWRTLLKGLNYCRRNKVKCWR